jgi:hypothetical protein
MMGKRGRARSLPANQNADEQAGCLPKSPEQRAVEAQ